MSEAPALSLPIFEIVSDIIFLRFLKFVPFCFSSDVCLSHSNSFQENIKTQKKAKIFFTPNTKCIRYTVWTNRKASPSPKGKRDDVNRSRDPDPGVAVRVGRLLVPGLDLLAVEVVQVPRPEVALGQKKEKRL